MDTTEFRELVVQLATESDQPYLQDWCGMVTEIVDMHPMPQSING